MKARTRHSVDIVQQGVWDLPLESMPLAAGYLKASALADERIRGCTDINIRNFRGGDRLLKMAQEIFAHDPPDVIAFSVLGWNLREFGALAETFRQVNPEGWVIFGGTHVAHQAERTFRLYPEVDVIVNGEGELVFRELLVAHLEGRSCHDLADIPGISYRNARDEIVTTEAGERIQDLDVIPSPFLSGAIELLDDAGNFRYDVALMETNRGCPYKCSFCYWGGAVGQRVRAFSRERLRAEVELFAKHGVHTLVLCDANFGMFPTDEEFVDDVIDVQRTYGFPKAIETSWAKNKSALFYKIVRKMKEAKLRSSFTLALQSLDDTVLGTMNRRNMKVNEWEDLAAWLDREGLDCYAELIWGAPGETVESFMRAYDRLSRHVSRIAVYPLHLLPNTDFTEKKAEYGIVPVRGDDDDFEYILAHDTMTLEENRRVKRFLFWSRVMAENAVLRNTWVGIRELSDLAQSAVLTALDEWVATTDDPAAEPLRPAVGEAANDDVSFGEAASYLLGDPAAKAMLTRWWNEVIRPLLPPEHRPVLDEMFRYDLLTHPFYRHPGATGPVEELPVVRCHGADYYVRRGVVLEYDVPQTVVALRTGTSREPVQGPVTVDLHYRMGAENFIRSTNHEEIVYFMGYTGAELLADGAGADE